MSNVTFLAVFCDFCEKGASIFMENFFNFTIENSMMYNSHSNNGPSIYMDYS